MNVLEWGCSPFVTSRPTIRTNRCSYSYPKVRSIHSWSVSHGTASRFSWTPSAYVSLTRLWLCLLLTPYEPFYNLTFSEGRRDMGASAHASVYRKNLRYPTSFYSKRRAALKQKGLQRALLYIIYYISPKVGSPESRTQLLFRSRFWLAPFYVISQALTNALIRVKARRSFRCLFGLLLPGLSSFWGPTQPK